MESRISFINVNFELWYILYVCIYKLYYNVSIIAVSRETVYNTVIFFQVLSTLYVCVLQDWDYTTNIAFYSHSLA